MTNDINITIFKEFNIILNHAYYYSNQVDRITEVKLLKYIEEHGEFPIDTFHTYGGRGSGKSINVYLCILLHAMLCPHDILLIRWIQASIKQSSHSQLKQLIYKYNLSDYFYITNQYIQCTITGARIEFKGLYGNIDNIRSLSDSFKVIVLEECQSFRDAETQALLATIYRFEHLLLITIQNVYFYSNSIYQRFIVLDDSPKTEKLFINWNNNPYFNDAMKRQKDKDELLLPKDEFDAIWNGIPLQSLNNAIFNKQTLDKLFRSNNTVIPMEFEKVIVSLDPAVSDKNIQEEDKSNSSAITVAGYYDNVCYILDMWCNIASPDIVIDKCIEYYHQYKADYILYEENQGGLYIKSLILNKDKYVQTKSFRSISNKIQRASQLVLPINNNRVKCSNNIDHKELEDQMTRITNNGFIQNYKNESPDLLDSLGFAVIDLLKLNQKGTVNTVLPLSKTFEYPYILFDIIIAYNEGNIMYALDISIHEEYNSLYFIVNKVLVNSVECFTIDKKYKYGFLPNILIDNSHNIETIYNINKLEKTSNMLKYVRPIQINDNNLRDIWDNYNDDTNDDILLQLLMHGLSKIS